MIAEPDMTGTGDGGGRRKGKIARLSAELRELVSGMMADGRSYPQIVVALREKGVDGITESNLSNWFQGGFKDWESQQRRLDDMERKREFALQIVRANEGSTVHEAASQLAASQLYEVLGDFDPAVLKRLLDEKPANYARVVNSLAKLGEGALKYEKYRAVVQEQRQKIEAELGKARTRGGLSPETIETIERELKLL